MLHLFSRCFMLHSFHVGLFLCYTLFVLHFFHAALFSCCTLFRLLSSRVALFPRYTFFIMYSFHVAPFFVCNSFHIAPFSVIQCSSSFVFYFFRVVSCFMLVHFFLFHLFHFILILQFVQVALFSYFSFFTLQPFYPEIFSWWTHVTPLFVLHCFHVVPFLHSFHVAPFPCRTFLMLYFFHNTLSQSVEIAAILKLPQHTIIFARGK